MSAISGEPLTDSSYKTANAAMTVTKIRFFVFTVCTSNPYRLSVDRIDMNVILEFKPVPVSLAGLKEKHSTGYVHVRQRTPQ